MNKVVITSFSSLLTAEGENIAFTYSVINENGEKVKENVRKSLILVEDGMIDKVKEIRDFLVSKAE